MNDNIRTLIDRFLDGATTPAEEHILYSYFSSEQVDPALEQYRDMFAWYASLPAETPAEPVVAHRHRAAWHLPAGIAAAVALAVAIALSVFAPRTDDQEALYAMYQGSYIEVNGQRITDVRLIYDRLQQAEALADSLCRDFDDNTFDAYMANKALRGISDSDITSHLLNEKHSNS